MAMIGLLLTPAVTGFGYRHCIRNRASETVKQACARKPV
jgi:hypothetical protein